MEFKDYKVADINLADWGRKEIKLEFTRYDVLFIFF